MSFTANLSGHFTNVDKQDEAQRIIDEAARQIEAVVDREAGDTFSGSFAGSENRTSTYPLAQ